MLKKRAALILREQFEFLMRHRAKCGLGSEGLCDECTRFERMERALLSCFEITFFAEMAIKKPIYVDVPTSNRRSRSKR